MKICPQCQTENFDANRVCKSCKRPFIPSPSFVVNKPTQTKSALNIWVYVSAVLGAVLIAFIAYSLGTRKTEPEKRLSDNIIDLTNKSSQNTTISGQIFIVTKGRENIKLALVTVCAVPEDVILDWIENKKSQGQSGQVSANQKVMILKQQLQPLQKQRDAIPYTQYELKHQLAMKVLDIETNILKAQIERDYWTSPEWYLKDLAGCEVTAKSDAEGKFSITLPTIKRYALAVQTERKVVDSTEIYNWLIWADSPNIVLSNDNLMEANPVGSVMQITNKY